MPYQDGKWIDPVYRGDDSWFGILAILGVILGIPFGIYLLSLGIQYYEKLQLSYQIGELIGFAVIGVVAAIVASSLVYSIYVAITDWWNGLWPNFMPADQNTTSTINNSRNTSYLAPKKPAVYKWNRNTETAGIPAGLIAGDRQKPPQAVFFGRLDGLPVAFTGLYEEKYLNQWEKKYWDKQKAKDPSLYEASESVNPSPGLEDIDIETKIVKW